MFMVALSRLPVVRGKTIFRDPGRMDALDPIREGYGEGCYIVVKAGK
jgi:hypothetical protein